MKKPLRIFTLFLMVITAMVFTMANEGCGNDHSKSADHEAQKQQEKIQSELQRQKGLPGIKNGREMTLLKMLYEIRDQEGLVTYTYLWSMTGKLIFVGETIGYGMPYGTQYSNPQKAVDVGVNGYHFMALPQSEPNGLFPPSSAHGTWVMMRNPSNNKVEPQYLEPDICVFTFKIQWAEYPGSTK
jgi:hypothetical protein